MQDQAERRTYDLLEAGRLLGLGRNATYDAARRGELPTIRIGRRLLVAKEAFERLLRGEAVRLDVKDVDLPGNRIFIPGRGRSQKRELVSLPAPTRAALAAWLEARGSEPGPLFVNFDRAGKGRRLTGAAIYHIVGWLGTKAGLAVRPQGLRHLAIATALERGLSQSFPRTNYKEVAFCRAYLDATLGRNRAVWKPSL